MEHLHDHYKPSNNTPGTLPQNITVGCSPGQYLSCSIYFRSLSFSFFNPSCEKGTEYNKDRFNVTERAKYCTCMHSSERAAMQSPQPQLLEHGGTQWAHSRLGLWLPHNAQHIRPQPQCSQEGKLSD